MPAKATKPNAAKKAAPRRSAAPKTVAACEREMRKHETAFRAYMAARKRKNAAETAAARKPHEAEMRKHNPGYTAYWRAYTRALALRKEAS